VTQASGAVLVRGGRVRSGGQPAVNAAGKREARESRREYQTWARLVKHYYKRLVNRSNGTEKSKPAALKTKAAAPGETNC
jgi:hypothetical protein